MKRLSLLLSAAVAMAMSGSANADLFYGFNTDAEGFQNVTWQAGPAGWTDAPTVQQNHTAGGWQSFMTKEFSWEAGGGSANQQLEMQSLANQVSSRIAFDLMVDGNSFPAGAETWYQFSVIGNSGGAAGWTQIDDIFAPASGWHSADDPTLISLHIDRPFSDFGWEVGDTWFQLWTVANSDGAVPVNFYMDNVNCYAVPEPSALALAGLGAAMFLIRRRK